MGLPSAYVINSNTQTDILLALEAKGFCDILGHADSISDEVFSAGISEFMGDPKRLANMRELGLKNVDGKGIGRVVGQLAAHFR